MGSIKIALGIVLTLFLAATSYGKTYTVKSPDGMLEASVSDGQKLLLSLKADGKAIFVNVVIGVVIAGLEILRQWQEERGDFDNDN